MCPTLCDPVYCSIPGFPVLTISQSLLKLMSIESVMPPNHLILSCILLLPSIFPNIRIFSNESTLPIRWPNTGASASASVLPMNIYGWLPLVLTGLISLQSKGLSRVFSSTTVWKHQFFNCHFLFWVFTSQIWSTVGNLSKLALVSFVCDSSFVRVCRLSGTKSYSRIILHFYWNQLFLLSIAVLLFF